MISCLAEASSWIIFLSSLCCVFQSLDSRLLVADALSVKMAYFGYSVQLEGEGRGVERGSVCVLLHDSAEDALKLLSVGHCEDLFDEFSLDFALRGSASTEVRRDSITSSIVSLMPSWSSSDFLCLSRILFHFFHLFRFHDLGLKGFHLKGFHWYSFFPPFNIGSFLFLQDC